MTIGDRIRRIRKKRRLTQAELAMMSGLSLSAIQGYEQDRYEPKRKSLESIAEVFKIPVDELYDMPTQLSTNLAEVGTDCISRQAAIDATKKHYRAHDNDLLELIAFDIEQLPSVQPETEWNNHTVACLLAELFGDDCACNYNGIDEWLPEKCEVIDACPNPVGVACWEQFLKHRAERRTDE